MKIQTSCIRVLDENRIHEDGKTGIIESVGKIGIINPVAVYIDKEGPVLVAGHRRLESAIHFGLREIECNVVPKEKAEEIRALENIDRKNLGPMDEAIEINNLFAKGYSRSEIAAIMGTNESRIARRAKLNGLCESAVKMLKEGKIALTSAEELATIDDKELQETIIKKNRKNLDVQTIRHEHFINSGVPLRWTSEEFRSMAGCSGTGCAECPNNPASDTLLFSEGNDSGCCRNVSCWMQKIEAIMQNHGAKGICSYMTYTNPKADEVLKKAFADKDTKIWSDGEKHFVHAEYAAIDDFPELSKVDSYVTLLGTLVYDNESLNLYRPVKKDEKQILEDEFREKGTELRHVISNFIKDCVKAYDKTHTRNLDRDSAEYMLAEYALRELANGWGANSSLVERVTGPSTADDYISKNSACTVYNTACVLMKALPYEKELKHGYVAQKDPLAELPDYAKLDEELGTDVYARYAKRITGIRSEMASMNEKYSSLTQAA